MPTRSTRTHACPKGLFVSFRDAALSKRVLVMSPPWCGCTKLLISSDCLKKLRGQSERSCPRRWRLADKPSSTRHSSWRSMNCQRVAKIEQLGRGYFCETLAMTTKTIPAYLEDERQKGRDAQL